MADDLNADAASIPEAFKNAGGGAVDNMYRMILARLDAGERTEVGNVPTLTMSLARYVRDQTGKLRSVDELKAFSAEVQAARTAADGIRELLVRHVPGVSQTPVAAPPAPTAPDGPTAQTQQPSPVSPPEPATAPTTPPPRTPPPLPPSLVPPPPAAPPASRPTTPPVVPPTPPPTRTQPPPPPAPPPPVPPQSSLSALMNQAWSKWSPPVPPPPPQLPPVINPVARPRRKPRTRLGRWWDRRKRSKTGRAVKGFGRTAWRGAKKWAGRTRVGRGLGKVVSKFRAARNAKTPAAAGGKLAGALGAAAEAAWKFGKAVVEAGEKQLGQMRKLSEVSASMSAVMAQLDMKQLFRDMERGQRLSPSAKGLADAVDKRRESTKEIGILADRVANGVLEVGNKAIAAFMTPLNEIAKGVNKLIDGDKKKQEEGRSAVASDFFQELARIAEKEERDGKDRIRDQIKGDEENRKLPPRKPQ